MSECQRPRAVLDADIIFSRVLHELMGRIAAELRLLDLFWSEQLLDEAQRSLIQKKQLPAESARRRVDYLRMSFPAGRINLDPQAPDTVDLTLDPADAHVCAPVVAAHADYLFTHDRGYLRDGLGRHRVQVLAPDEFLADVLDSDAREVLGVLELQASAWAGGHEIGELLDALERAGATVFTRKVRELI